MDFAAVAVNGDRLLSPFAMSAIQNQGGCRRRRQRRLKFAAVRRCRRMKICEAPAIAVSGDKTESPFAMSAKENLRDARRRRQRRLPFVAGRPLSPSTATIFCRHTPIGGQNGVPGYAPD